MIYFWDQIIQPVLQLTQPRRIVEIGCAQGFNTSKLLAYVQPIDQGKLIAIDPAPQFDVQQLQQQYGAALEVHPGCSLAVLPHIQQCDAALIDGDHNWYTVYHELKLFAQMDRFPLLFLHDLEWPYARRDMYYFPESIPLPFRKPHAKKGILPGVSELVEAGHNASVDHAHYEHGARNGVLTAVEDFMAESQLALHLHRVQSQFGLGILLHIDSDEQRTHSAQIKHLIAHSGL